MSQRTHFTKIARVKCKLVYLVYCDFLSGPVSIQVLGRALEDHAALLAAVGSVRSEHDVGAVLLLPLQ